MHSKFFFCFFQLRIFGYFVIWWLFELFKEKKSFCYKKENVYRVKYERIYNFLKIDGRTLR